MLQWFNSKQRVCNYINDTPTTFEISGLNGSVSFSNWSVGQTGIISSLGGKITVDSTCTSGTLLSAGPARHNDESTGTFVFDTTSIVSDTVWDELKSEHTTSGTMGLAMTEMSGTISDIDTSLTVVSGNIDTANTNIESLQAEVLLVSGAIDFIKSIEGGKWIIDETVNQMIFYKNDNSTEIARFNLLD